MLNLIVSVAGLVACVSAPPSPPSNTDPWRFANVKEWRVIVTIIAQDRFTKIEEEREENHIFSLGGTFEAKLLKKKVNKKYALFTDGVVEGYPSTITFLNRSLIKRKPKGGKPTWLDRRIEGAGFLATGGLELEFEPDKAVYRFPRVNWILKKGAMKVWSSDGQNMSQEMPAMLPFHPDAIMGKELPLPKSGMVIEGSHVFEWPSPPFTKTDDAHRNVMVTCKWSIMPWTDEAGDPKLEGDENWMPDDELTTMVKCKWKGVASEIRYTLYDVSKEPGKCMNSEDNGTDPDLEIMQGAEYQVEAIEGGWRATAKVAGESMSVLPLTCHDYGARGKVKCEVKINGKWETAKANGKDYLNVPKDDDENKIADAYEKKFGVKGKDVSDDTDKSDGNSNDGDGFTLYEEYRGMMAKGTHRRLNPKKKELMVVNQAGSAVDGGMKLFAKAADFDVVEVNRDEMDGSRVVNYRKATVGKGGDQYGLILANGPTDGGAAQVQPGQNGAKYTASPKSVAQVNFSSEIGAFGATAAAKDVAHELGHACGLRHHGDEGVVRLESTVYDASGGITIKANHTNWKVFDAKGVEITTRPFSIPAGAKVAFAKDTPASGDVGCVMCYESVFSFSFKAEGGINYLLNKADVAPGTMFCTSPNGTVYNLESHQPFSVFGNAQSGRGNCKSKLKVKDW